MTKLLTKLQPGQDELARPGKRAASPADASATSPARDASAAHLAVSAAHNDAPHIAKHDKGSRTARPALGSAYAAYTSLAPTASAGAHAHVAPSSAAPLWAAPTWPTLPTAPTRLEASLTTVGDLARRYPSVAAFVQAGLPTPFEPAPTQAKQPNAVPTAKSAPVARHSALPVKPATSMRQRFAELRTALAEGWEIVQPIFARPLWSVADDSATAFNFVLIRAQATRLVTVPEGRTVSRFIHEQTLVVDYRR